MMSNLFSTFDPSSNLNLSLNWLSTGISLIIIPMSFWIIPSRLQMFWYKIILILHKEFKLLMNNPNNSTLMFTSLFSLIIINNFMGMFPYIFTSTAHLTMSVSLALPMWVSFMTYGWIINTNHMLTHLVPQGTPNILAPFMVCIETISNLIRPLTLAIRLSANMIAGHLLMTLLGNTGIFLETPLIPILMITQILLLLLEIAVAMIQSYVFAILMTLYSSETN